MLNQVFEQRITDTDRRDLALITYYEEGHTKEETAERFGLSLSYTKTLINHIVKSSRPLEAKVRLWFGDFESGMTTEQIAEKYEAFEPFVIYRISMYRPLYYPAP